ncbi:MAG: hypothetical protein EPO55_04575 [Reyranella sp.]|uniref:hypothetical protein n=1 Tax=Reyranella sp. TaxID=1929291 RepID=UPI0012220155|nr:hypothetical protein [Reyranella sp.]TAJ41735.1 MAG: hypothetical protein EPO55_04575 [Reyranella sp.]
MAVTSGLSVSRDFHDGALAALKPRSAWALSWPLALGMVLFVFLANAEGLPLLGDPDSHWHIAVGNWMLAHGTVPTVDTFSFTFAGQPWIAKEWLSQLLMALAFNIGGWGGVTVLSAAAIGVSFALLLRLLLRDLTPLPAALFTLAAIVMTAPHFLARPHLLAFPVMLWWVAGLVRAVEQRRAPEPLLLLAMLLWANLHGGFTLGLVLCGAFALDAVVGARDAVERKALFVAWAKFGVASGLVACITPYGPESILVTLRIFGLGETLGMISEWKSPDFQSQPMQELILLVALYAALSRGLKLPLVRLLIVIGLVHLYLRYARNAELLAMLLPLVVAPPLARQWPSLRPDPDATGGSLLVQRMRALARPAGHAALALCFAAVALYAAGLVKLGGVTPPPSTMPQAALDYASEAGLKGHVLNHYNYGGYLIRAGVPTFIDGRGELYGGEFIRRFADVVNLRGEESLEQMLERHAIEWTLFPRNQPANKLLARLPGWRQAYTDESSTIFVRDR